MLFHNIIKIITILKVHKIILTLYQTVTICQISTFISLMSEEQELLDIIDDYKIELCNGSNNVLYINKKISFYLNYTNINHL